MDTKTSEIKERYIFRIEPSLIQRIDAIAEMRFGGNRSLVVRDAIKRHVDAQERDLGITPGERKDEAA